MRQLCNRKLDLSTNFKNNFKRCTNCEYGKFFEILISKKKQCNDISQYVDR